MAQTKPLNFYIKSAFDEEAAKAFGAKSLEELYTEMLLPSAEQKASAAASTIYGQRKQQAAEAASYDISKAYANYLKQQRNVAGAANLMAGHKEELSSALRSDYETAYSQARASESQILSKAASEASDIYSDVYKTESAAAKSLYDTLMKDVNLKTDLYKALEEKVFSEEYIQSLGVNTGYTTASGEYVPFNVYETVDGATKLTDYGMDIMSRALLEDPDNLMEYLSKSGRQDLQDYYLNNASSFRELAFGITDSEYRLSEESKALSNQRLFGTEGYLEAFESPEISNTLKGWDKDVKNTLSDKTDELYKYAQQINIELTSNIITTATNKFIKEFEQYVESEIHGRDAVKNYTYIKTVKNALAEFERTNDLKKLLTEIAIPSEGSNAAKNDSFANAEKVYQYIVDALKAENKKIYRGE